VQRLANDLRAPLGSPDAAIEARLVKLVLVKPGEGLEEKETDALARMVRRKLS
jgi:hypothetical protein